MDYEIRTVANGYLVQPAFAINRGCDAFDPKRVFVFPTAREAAEWLAAQMELERAAP